MLEVNTPRTITSTTPISTNSSNPPLITAQAANVTGTWVGPVRNNGVDGDTIWLNMTQVGNRVSGTAYLRPYSIGSYLLLGSFSGGFNSLDELDIRFYPSSEGKQYSYSYEARFKLSFYARSPDVKAIGNIWMNLSNTSDTNLVRSLDLLRK